MWTRWLRCKLGLHEGDISCDLTTDTVTYSCRFCGYTLTDPISPRIWRELDRELERRSADARSSLPTGRPEA